MEKNLENKAIDIKGKKYVLVSDRILYFNDEYTNGSITTELVSQPTDKIVCIKATVIPDVDKPARKFNGYAQEVWGEGFINKSSAIENAETSAIGRALGMMGIGVIDSVASVDEINKANNRKTDPKEFVKEAKPAKKKFTVEDLERLAVKLKENPALFIDSINAVEVIGQTRELTSDDVSAIQDLFRK